MNESAQSHPPMTHASALDWCASRRPDAGVPKSGCPGTLRLTGTHRLPGAAPPEAEVAVLVCRRCGVELAVGRGLTPESRILAPGLHGRLLWISTPGGGFDFVDPEFTHLARGDDEGDAPPGPGPGPDEDARRASELAEAMEDLRRSGAEIAGLARGLIDRVDRQGEALGRLHGLIRSGGPG